VTDEEADAIEEEKIRAGQEVDEAARERAEVEEDIRECTKAVWGNLGACYTISVSGCLAV
jgi:hypothetical protein